MPSRPARDRRIVFGRFALDTANARLFRDDEPVAVRGKTLAVLGYLATRPGELVTKDELLEELWPEVYVSEDVLVGCIRELRQIFGDARGTPRFIETVYRRGYRWIAPDAAPDGVDAPAAATTPSTILDRDADLAELRQRFMTAARGTRQVIFVTGDAGIGKTTLVDAFVAGVVSPARVARGHCVEQYGPAEPFLPILDALARCASESVLASEAPASGAGAEIMPERAVRLLGGAVEALGAERPLVLVLEDLHWSDPSTIDVLSYLARRPDPCRLLVLATYRPTELILRRHPLRAVEQELRAHRQSVLMPLSRLTSGAVARWLEARGATPPPEFVAWLHRRTEGHPLFLVTLFDALLDAGLVARRDGAWTPQPGYADFGVPESLRLMIEHQAAQLDDADRHLVEAASAAGAHFSAATVAAATERELLVVEARCDTLARDGHFVRAVGTAEWPDGTVAGTYEFIHDLYRSTLYARLAPAQARALHQRIGARLEAAYRSRADEIATELSVHFARARDASRAATYLEKAAASYTRRGAHREAIATLRRAVEMVALLPATPERTDRLVFLNLRLGASLLVAEDYADPEVKATFERCRDLADRAAALPPLLSALAGLHTYHAARAELGEMARIVPRLLDLAERLPVPQAALVAHSCAAWFEWSRGALAAACAHGARAIASEPSSAMEFPAVFDVVGYAFGTTAFAEMARGNVAAARALSDKGMAWSRQSARPVDRATALTLAALLEAFSNDPVAAAARARDAVAVAAEHGFRQWRATAAIVAAWAGAVARGDAESLAVVIASIDEYTRMGLRTQLAAFLCLAAGAHVAAGTPRVAHELLARAEAHVHDSGEAGYTAELHRLRGELAAARSAAKAEEHFRRAIDVARGQEAKCWELRATVSLAALARRQRRPTTARHLLEPVLSWFPKDADAPDLRAGRALLARVA